MKLFLVLASLSIFNACSHNQTEHDFRGHSGPDRPHGGHDGPDQPHGGHQPSHDTEKIIEELQQADSDEQIKKVIDDMDKDDFNIKYIPSYELKKLTTNKDIAQSLFNKVGAEKLAKKPEFALDTVDKLPPKDSYQIYEKMDASEKRDIIEKYIYSYGDNKKQAEILKIVYKNSTNKPEFISSIIKGFVDNTDRKDLLVILKDLGIDEPITAEYKNGNLLDELLANSTSNASIIDKDGFKYGTEDVVKTILNLVDDKTSYSNNAFAKYQDNFKNPADAYKLFQRNPTKNDIITYAKNKDKHEEISPSKDDKLKELIALLKDGDIYNDENFIEATSQSQTLLPSTLKTIFIKNSNLIVKIYIKKLKPIKDNVLLKNNKAQYLISYYLEGLINALKNIKDTSSVEYIGDRITVFNEMFSFKDKDFQIDSIDTVEQLLPTTGFGILSNYGVEKNEKDDYLKFLANHIGIYIFIYSENTFNKDKENYAKYIYEFMIKLKDLNDNDHTLKIFIDKNWHDAYLENKRYNAAYKLASTYYNFMENIYSKFDEKSDLFNLPAYIKHLYPKIDE